MTLVENRVLVFNFIVWPCDVIPSACWWYFWTGAIKMPFFEFLFLRFLIILLRVLFYNSYQIYHRYASETIAWFAILSFCMKICFRINWIHVTTDKNYPGIQGWRQIKEKLPRSRFQNCQLFNLKDLGQVVEALLEAERSSGRRPKGQSVRFVDHHEAGLVHVQDVGGQVRHQLLKGEDEWNLVK